MSKSILYLAISTTTLSLFVLVEPAWANKFITIGGGVSGTTPEKIKLLKVASLIMGSILCVIGLLSLVPLFQGSSDLKTPKITLPLSAAFVVCGGILISLYFFK